VRWLKRVTQLSRTVVANDEIRGAKARLGAREHGPVRYRLRA